MEKYRYDLQTIDKYNLGNIRIPNISKYSNLLQFIDIEQNIKKAKYADKLSNHTRLIAPIRGQPNTSVTSSRALRVEDTVDAKLICKINELSSKINGHSVSHILDQFRKLDFDKASDIANISRVLHNSIMSCYKYGDVMLELFAYLIIAHPVYMAHIRSKFLDYPINKLESLKAIGNSDEELETRFGILRTINNNYELIIKCFKKRLFFDETVIDTIIKSLVDLDNIESIESLIRFLILLKNNQITRNISSDISMIEELIRKGSYPKRFEFLLMDLE